MDFGSWQRPIHVLKVNPPFVSTLSCTLSIFPQSLMPEFSQTIAQNCVAGKKVGWGWGCGWVYSFRFCCCISNLEIVVHFFSSNTSLIHDLYSRWVHPPAKHELFLQSSFQSTHIHSPLLEGSQPASFQDGGAEAAGARAPHRHQDHD